MVIESITNLDGPCQGCGFDYIRGYRADERRHKVFHDNAVKGRKTKLTEGCHVVTHGSAMTLQKLVQAAAVEALYETKYDFISFCACKKEFDADKTVAIILVQDGRVNALIVSRERDCELKLQLGPPDVLEKANSHKRRSVDMIWVLKNRRGQGLAKAIIEGLLDHCRMKVEDLAHLKPINEDALRLWRRLHLASIYLA